MNMLKYMTNTYTDDNGKRVYVSEVFAIGFTDAPKEVIMEVNKEAQKSLEEFDPNDEGTYDDDSEYIIEFIEKRIKELGYIIEKNNYKVIEVDVDREY